MLTVPKDYKKLDPPQSSPSDISQSTTSFTEVKNSLHGSKTSLNQDGEIQEASSSAPSTVIHDSKTRQKNSEYDSQSPRRQNKKIFN